MTEIINLGRRYGAFGRIAVKIFIRCANQREILLERNNENDPFIGVLENVGVVMIIKALDDDVTAFNEPNSPIVPLVKGRVIEVPASFRSARKVLPLRASSAPISRSRQVNMPRASAQLIFSLKRMLLSVRSTASNVASNWVAS